MEMLIVARFVRCVNRVCRPKDLTLASCLVWVAEVFKRPRREFGNIWIPYGANLILTPTIQDRYQ